MEPEFVIDISIRSFSSLLPLMPLSMQELTPLQSAPGRAMTEPWQMLLMWWKAA